MINISSTQPVSWPTAQPVVTPPVSPVAAVGAAQASAREGKTDSGRNGSQSGQSRSSGGAAADSSPVQPPLLPRERSDSEQAKAAKEEAAETRLRAEQQAEQEAAAKEKAEQKRQLQDVLASVWRASAAVVDAVLGREKTSDEVSATGVREGGATSEALAAAEEEVDADAGSPTAGAADDESALVLARRDQDPVVYTEQGASSFAPLEAGQLISQRV